MRRTTGWLAAGMAAVMLVIGTAGHAADRKKGVYQAERAGWMLGMYVGEEKGYPYPFVLQLDEKSDAKQKGIRVGDELIRFQNEEVNRLKHVFTKVNGLRPGKEVALWVRRGSQTLQFRVRVPRPESEEDEKKAAEKAKAKAEKAEQAAEDGEEGKKKKKKQPRVIIKPIPADD